MYHHPCKAYFQLGENNNRVQILTGTIENNIFSGSFTLSDTIRINNLIAGDYKFIAVDTINCFLEDTITISQPDSISITNHGLVTGQKIIHKSETPTGGLIHEKEYFVYVINSVLRSFIKVFF